MIVNSVTVNHYHDEEDFCVILGLIYMLALCYHFSIPQGIIIETLEVS